MPQLWNTETLAQTGVVLTTIERMDQSGAPWIRMPDGHRAVAQLVAGISTDSLSAAMDSQTPVVVALAGNPPAPIILGILSTGAVPPASATPPLVAEIDGKQVTLQGQEEITLRCGRASITLTKAGKILLRGTYLSSRSSGVNRIKGGSVQIN